MGRPAFALTDHQARLLASRVAELHTICPLDPRNHRPFIRGFIQAVHQATGQLYSPTVYHRLLGAFAPDRRASTSTLEAEKLIVAAQLVAVPTVVAAPGAMAIQPNEQGEWISMMHTAVTEAVDQSMARAAGVIGASAVEARFLAARLKDAEAQLQQLRASAAQLATELAVARQSAQQYAAAAAHADAARAREAEVIATLTAEVADIRNFALRSIDESRGESRAWKERSVALEAHRQHDARLMETFRQLAYQRGAAIPAPLLHDKTK